MKLLLEDTDIKLILSEHKDYIGKNALNGIDSIMAAIALTVTICFSDFSSTTWLFYVLLVTAILYFLWGIRNVYSAY